MHGSSTITRPQEHAQQHIQPPNHIAPIQPNNHHEHVAPPHQLNNPGPHHPPLNQPQRILQRAKHAVPFPNPATDTNEIYLLKFCPAQVRTCFGCMQPLKPGGYVPHPPYDLVVVSKMMREFTSPQGLNMQKESNLLTYCTSTFT